MRKFLKKLKSSDFTSSSLKKKKQSIFPFLSLPAEIRNRIYYYLFDCGAGYHLIHHSDKIYCIRCREWDQPDMTLGCCREVISKARRIVAVFGSAIPQYGDIQIPVTPDSIHKFPLKPLPTSILYTCRQISNEALTILYSAPRFFQTDDLKTWVDFAESIPQSHLSLIRTLKASFLGLPCLTMAPVYPPIAGEPYVPSEGLTGYAAYERYTVDDRYAKFWEVVRDKMPGLRELVFMMDYEGQFLDRRTEAEWVQEIVGVRGLRRFRVFVSDRIRGREGKGEDVERGGREERVLNEWLEGLVCKGRKEGKEAVVEDVAEEGAGKVDGL
ncbi:hypothetical protein FQN54_003854 [Arachnomyces sp. PD_36]|nr:hypothetical protein FQN54_003854 [Arachnomyces sp. PD_36]